MAKLSVPAPSEGLRKNTHSAVERDIMGVLVKAFLADYGKDITVDELGTLIGEQASVIARAMQNLWYNEFIIRAPGFDVGLPFRIGRISIELVPADLLPEPSGQKKLDLDGSLSVDELRKRHGNHTVTIGETQYRGVVWSESMDSSDGSVYWALKIEAKDVGEDEWIVKVIDPVQFSTDTEAWGWFDEYLEAEGYLDAEPSPASVPTLSDWVDGLAPEEHEGNLYVFIDKESFEHLAQEFSAEGDQPFAWDFPGFGGGFVAEAVDGHRWPGLPTVKDSLTVESEESYWEWAIKLPRNDEDKIELDPETFDLVAKDLWEGQLDTPECFADLESGTCSTGNFHWIRTDDGARHPSLAPAATVEDKPDPKRSAKSQAQSGEDSVQLEDGEWIKVKWESAGRGRFDITLLGALNDSGFYKENVPFKEHRDDFTGWATKKAEALRARFTIEPSDAYPPGYDPDSHVDYD